LINYGCVEGSFGVVDKYSYNNEKENEYPLYLAIKTLNPELCGDSRVRAPRGLRLFCGQSALPTPLIELWPPLLRMQEVREFLEELRLMKKLDHGCIVDYKGFGTFHDKHGRKLIFVVRHFIFCVTSTQPTL
jgi:serine/threonine protein kinase